MSVTDHRLENQCHKEDQLLLLQGAGPILVISLEIPPEFLLQCPMRCHVCSAQEFYKVQVTIAIFVKNCENLTDNLINLFFTNI